jgi:hypothetical protein
MTGTLAGLAIAFENMEEEAPLIQVELEKLNK